MEIECLVLSGGGHLGFIELGALYHLEENKYFDRKKIKSYYGTSFGSILAVLLSTPLDWETSNDYMLKRPWDKVFELKSNNLLQIWENKGFFDEEISIKCLKPVLDAFDLPIDVNLKDYYEFSQVEINFITFNCSLCETKEINYKNYPDLPLYKAIYMSCCVPLLFKPLEWKDELYIDGGMEHNYPISYALKQYSKENILSFKIVYDRSNYSINKDTSFINYFSSLLMYNIVKLNDVLSTEDKFTHELIYTTSKETDTQDIIGSISSYEKRNELFEKGLELAKEYLQNKI